MLLSCEGGANLLKYARLPLLSASLLLCCLSLECESLSLKLQLLLLEARKPLLLPPLCLSLCRCLRDESLKDERQGIRLSDL